MAEPRDSTSPTDRELRELAALADGSLPPERRSAAEARADASPELRRALAEQRRVARAVRDAAAGVSAPAQLRSRIEHDRLRARPSPLRTRFGVIAGLAAAAAVAVVAVLALDGGAPAAAEAAALSQAGAEQKPPQQDPHHPGLLDARVDGVPYPDWEKIRWPASGRRDDRLGDRKATTVFYVREGKEAGYTIVSGEALEPPEGARRTVHEGIEFHEFEHEGRPAVMWTRDGRTCVMSSADGVERRVLLALAAWDSWNGAPF